MAIDGGLANLFKKNIPGDWTRIESTTGHGIPDDNFCINGIEGWIEWKKTTGWTVPLRWEQVAWLDRRGRNGGRVFIAVRRITNEVDELWLMDGRCAKQIKIKGLTIQSAPWKLLVCQGGPAKWDWSMVKELILAPYPPSFHPPYPKCIPNDL